MPRSGRVFYLFRFSIVSIMVSGGILSLMGRYDWDFTLSRMKAFIVCMFLVTATIFFRGSLSTLYVRLLKWVLQHLHTTEEHRWVIALAITALCDVFLNTLNMIPFVVLSALSMIMICVVAAGWDSDRSGMTEGLLIGYGKLLLVHMISSELLPSLLSGAVLVLAIASKLSERAMEKDTGDDLPVGTADSSFTAEV